VTRRMRSRSNFPPGEFSTPGLALPARDPYTCAKASLDIASAQTAGQRARQARAPAAVIAAEGGDFLEGSPLQRWKAARAGGLVHLHSCTTALPKLAIFPTRRPGAIWASRPFRAAKVFAGVQTASVS